MTENPVIPKAIGVTPPATVRADVQVDDVQRTGEIAVVLHHSNPAAAAFGRDAAGRASPVIDVATADLDASLVALPEAQEVARLEALIADADRQAGELGAESAELEAVVARKAVQGDMAAKDRQRLDKLTGERRQVESFAGVLKKELATGRAKLHKARRPVAMAWRDQVFAKARAERQAALDGLPALLLDALLTIEASARVEREAALVERRIAGR
jgi:hypothetical protein